MSIPDHLSVPMSPYPCVWPCPHAVPLCVSPGCPHMCSHPYYIPTSPVYNPVSPDVCPSAHPHGCPNVPMSLCSSPSTSPCLSPIPTFPPFPILSPCPHVPYLHTPVCDPISPSLNSPPIPTPSPCPPVPPVPVPGRVPGWALQGALGIGDSLLRSPRGCGEQSLMSMAPTAAALRFLDESEGWGQLPPGHRQRGLRTLQQGELWGRLCFMGWAMLYGVCSAPRDVQCFMGDAVGFDLI